MGSSHLFSVGIAMSTGDFWLVQPYSRIIAKTPASKVINFDRDIVALGECHTAIRERKLSSCLYEIGFPVSFFRKQSEMCFRALTVLQTRDFIEVPSIIKPHHGVIIVVYRSQNSEAETARNSLLGRSDQAIKIH